MIWFRTANNVRSQIWRPTREYGGYSGWSVQSIRISASSFGPWLTTRLRARRLRPSQAARLFGCNPGTNLQWRRGYGLPSYTQLTRIVRHTPFNGGGSGHPCVAARGAQTPAAVRRRPRQRTRPSHLHRGRLLRARTLQSELVVGALFVIGGVVGLLILGPRINTLQTEVVIAQGDIQKAVNDACLEDTEACGVIATDEYLESVENGRNQADTLDRPGSPQLGPLRRME